MLRRLRNIRKPDNVVWSWPTRAFGLGYAIQSYSFNAVCMTIVIGP